MISLFVPGAIRSLLMVFVVAVTGLLVCTGVIWGELHREMDFRERYGESWKSEYEQVFGSVGKAQARMVTAALGALAIIAIAIWLIRHVKKGQHATGRNNRRKRDRGSALDHAARARRNAIVGIYFGFIGIAVGVLLELFYWGIFSQFEDQQVVGGFVFLAGYAAVLSGCWWWLKAKAWSEGLVFIGLMPLAILLIPFVRIIFLASPALVAFSMVMSPIILVVVIFTLPDKSGSSNRHRSWNRYRRNRTKPEEVSQSAENGDA